MCGRYTLRTRLNQLLQLFAAETQVEWHPRFNIAPTQPIAAVRTGSGSTARELVLLRWGLIPSWADDESIGSRMINARSETLAEKPSFRAALKRRRCLILADGFYEWQKEGKAKQPYYIRKRDDRPFAFAGLWERWTKGGLPIESGIITTTSPNPLMSKLHDRMPVILSEEAAALWLNHDIEEPERLLPLLTPYPGDDLEVFPVNKLVSSPHNESPQCIEPLPPEELP